MNKVIFTFSLLIFIFTVGCSTTNSDNVNTEGFYVVFELTADGANTRGDATFYVGGLTGTVVQLSAGDSVTCNGNPMNESQDLFNRYYYWGGCGALTVDATYTFVFTRSTASGDEVYTSTVTMPEALTLTSPGDGSTHNRGAPINVTWTAGSDSIVLRLTGDGDSAESPGSTTTFSATEGAQADDGVASFTGTQTNPDSINGAITNARIMGTRSRDGSMDPLLAGTVSASQTEEITGMTINP
jgi:hypothetical protein